ncbi:MBL fold metallo-hydrolase [Kangiella shandongensis]|uniref:MBL fold metallo-hydrolase n=1 Tax=Kangiella shandongensis TaxID=2763258 RepID=UPI001CBE33F9|nr:MBL fold metallo-hydrolase [Kangiella shandongensis]
MTRLINGITTLTLTVIFFAWSHQALSHADARPEATIETQQLSDGLYVLFGKGGNIGLSVGEDGTYIIDDQFAPLTPQINQAIKEVTDESVRFVINTHWHGDHTGGNENYGKAGAVIVAHDNVRKRMSVENISEFSGKPIPASPDAALPVVTFDSEISLHLNDDDMRVYHVANAHTDGDAIIYFAKDNVLHMGDTYFNIGYPYIDTGGGGSIDGYISAVERGLALANDDTQIIPGHGPMSNKKELQKFGNMLKDLRQKIATLKDKGMSLQEVIAAKPSAEYDAENGQAFIKPKQIVTFIYKSL